MSAESLQRYIPQQRYFEFQYLRMFLHMLPFGAIWGAALNKISAVLYQDAIDAVSKYQDTQNTNSYPVYQDTIATADGGASSSFFGLMLGSFARELELLETAIIDLFRQQLPGTATDMLPDWEVTLGLPEDPLNPPTTFAERQDIAHAKLYTNYNAGLNAQFYIDYAARLGFVITIDDTSATSSPFYVAAVGVETFNIGSRVGDRLNDSAQISAVIFTIVSGPVDHTQLKYTMEKLKPAHVVIIWEE